jgi:hypothetical protein
VYVSGESELKCEWQDRFGPVGDPMEE